MSYKVLLCSFYPVFSGTGGAEKVFWRMSNELVLREYDVYALGFESKDNNTPFFEASSIIHKINTGKGYRKSILIQLICLFIFKADWRRKFRDTFEGKRKGKRILPAIKRISPDIIISYQIEMTFVLKEILKVDTPVITMLHNDVDILLRGKERIYKALKKGVLTQVLLPSFKERLSNYIAVNSVVIPNEVPYFSKISNQENNTIISVGRICSTKNQIDLIKAFGIFNKSNPSWKLVIIGDCTVDKDYYIKCTSLVIKKNLQNSVKFVGTTKTTYKYLFESSIFAFPSVFEGFPLALTEAMSMGLAVIGYKTCPGVNEIIHDGVNGYLVDNNYLSLAKQIELLANSSLLRKRIGLQASCDMKQYNTDKIYDKWNEIILGTINENYKK